MLHFIEFYIRRIPFRSLFLESFFKFYFRVAGNGNTSCLNWRVSKWNFLYMLLWWDRFMSFDQSINEILYFWKGSDTQCYLFITRNGTNTNSLWESRADLFSRNLASVYFDYLHAFVLRLFRFFLYQVSFNFTEAYTNASNSKVDELKSRVPTSYLLLNKGRKTILQGMVTLYIWMNMMKTEELYKRSFLFKGKKSKVQLA